MTEDIFLHESNRQIVFMGCRHCFYTNRHNSPSHECCLRSVSIPLDLFGTYTKKLFIAAGELVGDFGAFYNPTSGETKEMFLGAINKNV